MSTTVKEIELIPRTSLLEHKLLSVVVDAGEEERRTLPEVLERLGGGRDLEFTALRAHQQHAWHAFLVQVGALVAHRRGERRLDLGADAWREGLLELAGEAGEDAWSLVVEDLGRPAFLQNPVPEETLEVFSPKKAIGAPDFLDVVITSRNHDVKQGLIHRPRPEHWIYALVSVQTMEGYSGKFNYGIARMNGGYGSRPCVGAATSVRWTDRFRRDVAVWLDGRAELTRLYGYPDRGGAALLWTLPWDGAGSYPLRSCDPFFIEVCRRIRLTQGEHGEVLARVAGSAGRFLDADLAHGDTGDPWTPLKEEADGTAALSVAGSGFSYRLMSHLLLGGPYRRSRALELRAEDGPRPVVIAQALSRGQGKTDGYHERLVPIPERAAARFGDPEARSSLAKRAQARIERTRVAENSVLRPALCALLQGGKEQLDLRDKRAHRWIDRMDDEVDRLFFDDLWANVELEEEDARRSWDRRLYGLAQNQLEDAVRSAPVPLAVRPRSAARADLLLAGSARKHLPGAFETTEPVGGSGADP